MKKPTSSDAVHLWRVQTVRAPPELAARLSTLGPEERERAKRFRRENDRASFVMTRSALRDLLAEYVGGSASTLKFEYGPAGKPRLANHPSVQFNVSHSAGIALIAIGTDRRVGIDLEFQTRPIPYPSEDVFSSEEVGQFRANIDPIKSFYDRWTRKEALVKAIGVGFTVAAFHVRVGGGGTERLSGFEVQNLDVAPEFSAALAIECLPSERSPTFTLLDALG